MQSPRRIGITLIEVIVVTLILGAIAVFMMLPAVCMVRDSANRARCQNNLKQLMLGMHNLADVGGPVTPSSGGGTGPKFEAMFPSGCFGAGAAPEERHSWMVSLLPFIEQDNLYRQFDAEKGYGADLLAARTRIPTFVCPAGRAADGVTHYVALAGLGFDAAERPALAAGNGLLGYDRRASFKMIEDGTSNTLALIETRTQLGPWARGGVSNLRGLDPADSMPVGDGRAFGGHGHGALAAMADGGVRSIIVGVDPKQLAAAVTIAGGENLFLD